MRYALDLLSGLNVVLEGEHNGAAFNANGTWRSGEPGYDRRYLLWRSFKLAVYEPIVFVMLNPSTAGSRVDDPTVRRCIGFAKRWGFDGLIVANLFSLRSSDPRKLKTESSLVDPTNDDVLIRIANSNLSKVVAWGNFPSVAVRNDAELRINGLISASLGSKRSLQCFGRTKGGEPKHPLMLPNAEKLRDW